MYVLVISPVNAVGATSLTCSRIHGMSPLVFTIKNGRIGVEQECQEECQEVCQEVCQEECLILVGWVGEVQHHRRRVPPQAWMISTDLVVATDASSTLTADSACDLCGSCKNYLTICPFSRRVLNKLFDRVHRQMPVLVFVRSPATRRIPSRF